MSVAQDNRLMKEEFANSFRHHFYFTDYTFSDIMRLCHSSYASDIIFV